MKRAGIITVFFLMYQFKGFACPMCQGGMADNSMAYKATALLLMLLPLIMAGLLFRWIYHKYKDK